MIREQEALDYHAGDRPGKIEIKASKPCLSPREMRLAYLPGASFAVNQLAAHPEAAFQYTARGNLVAVVTNGTAVPGAGDVGPLAAKPMQEGSAVVLKRLADIDVYDLELDTRDPDRFVETIQMLEPTFGGINLRDIRAPEGLEIYERLRDSMGIPVFHENVYGSAVVVLAALINALDLVDKGFQDARVVICGAGNVGLGCARLLRSFGLPPENLLLYDIDGLVHPGRKDLNAYQAAFAREHDAPTLAQGLVGADVFIGASAGGVITPEMIRSMERFPIVFAAATPEPEISYEAARAARRDVLVATSVSVLPNTLSDLLSFPYILRGALDVQASRITEEMMLAAARALAELAREDVVDEVSRAYGYETFTFGPEYLIPKPIDPRILVRESTAVARQALADGVARLPREEAAYQEHLEVRLGRGREMMRQLIVKARQVNPRLVFPEGANETILRACGILVDEGIASPVLLGSEDTIHAAAEHLGLDIGGVTVVDPARSPSARVYADEYFRLRGRRGVTPGMARARLLDPRYFAMLMLHRGDADMMIAGLASHYADSMRRVLEVIGPGPGARRISSLYMILRPKEVYFLADCAVNIDPSAEDLAETALQAARMVRSLGIEPRVAMLSFANYGSVEHPFTRKVRRATELARERGRGLVVEGEIQLLTALDSEIRKQYFPFCELQEDANVLIFPDLQSGNLALHTVQRMGDAVLVGPVLMGTRRPVHLLQYGNSVQDVVNLTTIAAVEVGAETVGD